MINVPDNERIVNDLDMLTKSVNAFAVAADTFIIALARVGKRGSLGEYINRLNTESGENMRFADAPPKNVGKCKWGWPEYRMICGCHMKDFTTIEPWPPDFAITRDEIRLLPRRIDDFNEVYEGACSKCGQAYYMTASRIT